MILGSAPVESSKSLNIFMLSDTLAETGSTQTIGYNFEKNNIPASIIISGGGAIAIALIITILSGLFYLLIRLKLTSNIAIMLFDKFFAGILT